MEQYRPKPTYVGKFGVQTELPDINFTIIAQLLLKKYEEVSQNFTLVHQQFNHRKFRQAIRFFYDPKNTTNCFYLLLKLNSP